MNAAVVEGSGKNTAQFFSKGAPSGLVEKADKLVAELQNFSFNFNQKLLDLEKGYDFLDLSRQVGLPRFRKLIKAKFPYTYSEVVKFLSVAELHDRFPQFHDKILSLGVSACSSLIKASSELVSKILTSSGTTLADIKKFISREKKGLAVAPTPEHLEQLLVGAVVEVTVDAKCQGWLAEVVASPDEFGRVRTRLLKTCKSRQFFVDEVQLYSRTSDVDSNAVISPAEWGLLKIQYNLSDSDFETVKEVAYTHAQQSASLDAATIEVLWKHVFAALDSYEFKPVVVLAAVEADEDADTDTDEDGTDIKEQVRSLAEANQQLREAEQGLREELQAVHAKLQETEAENRRLMAAQQQALQATVDAKVQPSQPLAITVLEPHSELWAMCDHKPMRSVTEVTEQVVAEQSSSEEVAVVPEVLGDEDEFEAPHHYEFEFKSANGINLGNRSIDGSSSILEVAAMMAGGIFD